MILDSFLLEINRSSFTSFFMHHLTYVRVPWMDQREMVQVKLIVTHNLRFISDDSIIVQLLHENFIVHSSYYTFVTT